MPTCSPKHGDANARRGFLAGSWLAVIVQGWKASQYRPNLSGEMNLKMEEEDILNRAIYTTPPEDNDSGGVGLRNKKREQRKTSDKKSRG